VHIAVEEDQLSLAIGRRGQNARLTSRLTGWEINIAKDESVVHGFKEKFAHAITLLAKNLNIDEDTARMLANAGLNSVEGIVEADPKVIAEILQTDIDRGQQIYDAAKQEHERKLASI
jgi:N utilization substance protein A